MRFSLSVCHHILPHYILFPRRHPVLLQGPTSAGKTSLVQYLARVTGHKCLRVNNHEHTDLQEYIGLYTSGTNGELVFQEGTVIFTIHSSIISYPIIHPFVYPSIHSSIDSSIHSLIHPLFHLFIQSSIDPSINLLIHPSIYSSIHSLIHSFIHSFVHPFIHPLIPPYIH